MNIYAVIQLMREHNSNEIEKNLRDIDGNVCLTYSNLGIYFVRYTGTAKQISERVGFSRDHGKELGMVISVDRGKMFGFASKELWSWMSSS